MKKIDWRIFAGAVLVGAGIAAAAVYAWKRRGQDEPAKETEPTGYLNVKDAPEEVEHPIMEEKVPLAKLVEQIEAANREFEDAQLFVEISGEEFADNYGKMESRTGTYFRRDGVLAGWNDNLDEVDPEDYDLSEYVEYIDAHPEIAGYYLKSKDGELEYEIVCVDDAWEDYPHGEQAPVIDDGEVYAEVISIGGYSPDGE